MKCVFPGSNKLALSHDQTHIYQKIDSEIKAHGRNKREGTSGSHLMEMLWRPWVKPTES